MEVTSSSKYSTEVKVGEVTLHFSLTERGVWLTAKSSYGPRYVEKVKFNEARRRATEAIASHHFAPRDTESIVRLAIPYVYLHESIDAAVEALFSSLKIPQHSFLKWLVAGEVKKEMGSRSKKRAEKRAEILKKEVDKKEEERRQFVLPL